MPDAESRATCGDCGAEILPATAFRNDGRCKPCWRRRLKAEIGVTEYGREYDRVFRKPRLHSAKYLDCWLWVELDLASTLHETRDRGTAEYLFVSEARIKGVTTPQQYRERMLDRIAEMEHCVRGMFPENAEERADWEAMLQTVDDLRGLADLWLSFYLQRHEHWIPHHLLNF